MTPTPETDSAERFIHDARGEPFGFIPSALGRKLERALNAALHGWKNGEPYQEPSDLGGDVMSGEAGRQDRSLDATSATGSGDLHGKLSGLREATGVQSHADGQVVHQHKRKAAPDGAGDFVEYGAGDLLFSKGDPANHMAVIVDGSVEIFDPEHDRSIAIIGKGSFFGEQAILQGGVRAASVRAVDHVTCLEIKTEKLRSLLSEDSGLLMPSIEALLLQLCMANGITRAAEKPADERRFAVISESRISGVEVRKLLNEAYADENRNGFSSDQMLYLKLHASNKLHTVPFSDGQKLGVSGGEHPGAAYVVIEGEVEAEKDNYRVRLGLGSVIGLAEGFSNIPLCMTFSAIGHVTALILPMDQVLRGLQRTNPGIKAIVRYTAARIIDLEKSL